MAATEDSFRENLINSLSQQLSEFELLKSMYPNDDEIILTDTNVLEDIQNFVESEMKTEYTPNHLDFILNLNVDGLKLEISVNLPSFYPTEEPDLYVRCNQLNRQQETSLNLELSNYIKNNYVEEVCVYSAVLWLQENILNFNEQIGGKDIDSAPATASSDDKFVRYWIYSHHIYNKRKIDQIESVAKDFKLTGFCLPGKPGIICVEGPDSDCKRWWTIIRTSMTWKKIVLRTSEIFDISERVKEQRFHKFEEVQFLRQAFRTSHADMSLLCKYLEEHGLTHIFKDLFGLSEG